MDMKARVYHDGFFWCGEVYADWFFGGKCWRDVTSYHHTRIGATLALKNWLRKDKKYNIEIK